MASMESLESGFQTLASKKRKTSDSPSLPTASHPTMLPYSYKNRTSLIATGIDPKFNTQMMIMRELRQYHPKPQSFQNQAVAKWLDFYKRYSRRFCNPAE